MQPFTHNQSKIQAHSCVTEPTVRSNVTTFDFGSNVNEEL